MGNFNNGESYGLQIEDAVARWSVQVGIWVYRGLGSRPSCINVLCSHAKQFIPILFSSLRTWLFNAGLR